VNSAAAVQATLCPDRTSVCICIQGKYDYNPWGLDSWITQVRSPICAM
jgi:hypothetical protein